MKKSPKTSMKFPGDPHFLFLPFPVPVWREALEVDGFTLARSVSIAAPLGRTPRRFAKDGKGSQVAQWFAEDGVDLQGKIP